MNPDPLLSLNGVTIGYPGHPVLDNIRLTLHRGDCAALLGANGSGKTSLLKTIAGILPTLHGSLVTHPPNGPRPVVGYVPQREAFDDVYLLTGYDVALMGTFGRVGAGRFVTSTEREFVHECLRSTGAGELARRPFSRLSGGQKQRVLIARALAARPDLLLLDEPTSGIDSTTCAAIMALLKRIHAERQLTILLVTHDLGLVRRHLETVIWLADGAIRQGLVTELLTQERLNELLHLS
ncbi:MAG TPA: ATP-binding cassette domain-containing protein [Methylomirabilota bacterium]|nr:ATP-binding cassette domain-containing protein [Methylomirabilota bacterium]